jgi:omega-hydroxy-beta-dihydromenaquinone-9 sulfotransferase
MRPPWWDKLVLAQLLQQPAGRFHEIRFEELERDPLGQMRRLYKQLDLAGFETLRPGYERYLAPLAG